jgi:outer membrane protein TolC
MAQRLGGALALVLALLAPPCPAQGSAAPAPVRLIDVLHETLRRNPAVLLQQQAVALSLGVGVQARAPFDTVLSSDLAAGREAQPLRQDEIAAYDRAGLSTAGRQTVDTLGLRVAAQKQLADGMVVGASLSVSQGDDSLLRVVRIPVQTTGRVDFSLRVPLLRNRGSAVVGAPLRAADAEQAAAQLDLLHANARAVLDATLAYWGCVAGVQRLGIAHDAERRAAELLQEMGKLVQADQVARSELELLHAGRADKTAARLAAEQALQEAQRDLARSIGLEAGQAAAGLLPGDAFPPVDDAVATLVARTADLDALALRARADLAAADQRLAAASQRVTVSADQLRPGLDLNLNLGYRTLVEGHGLSHLSAYAPTARQGLVAGVALQYQWPLDNSAARGQHLAQAAQRDAASLRWRDLQAAISTGVGTVAQRLVRAAAQWQQAREAVLRYRVALQNERTRHRLARTTLIELLAVQDRLDNALLQEVQAQWAYAIGIATLQFETGQLVRQDGAQFSVEAHRLFSVRALGQTPS